MVDGHDADVKKRAASFYDYILEFATKGVRMPASFSDIENALFFVSSDSYGINTAFINIETGKIYYRSEMAYIGERDDEEEEIDSENLIEIPHKNDLDLGKELVFRFVTDNLPDDLGLVRSIFSRSGAYARFKDFLQSKALLDAWYEFEDKQTKIALKEWCEDKGLVLTE